MAYGHAWCMDILHMGVSPSVRSLGVRRRSFCKDGSKDRARERQGFEG